MARAYGKEFLLTVFTSRFECLGLDAVESMYKLGRKFYDEVGKDKFREYASLDAKTLADFKQSNPEISPWT